MNKNQPKKPKIWDRLLSRIIDELKDEARMILDIDGNISEGIVKIYATSKTAKQWLGKIEPDIRRIAEEFFDNEVGISLEQLEILYLDTSNAKKKVELLKEEFTFENFVRGMSNEEAYIAALAVANNLGVEHNPLFIYGDPGLGKTHLLQAICHKVLEKDPTLNIQYLPSSKLWEEFKKRVEAQEGIERLKESYSNLDLLVLDDIQGLSGKEYAQKQFFDIFNELVSKDKQIVIASDRPPDLLKGIEDRLVSRFRGGVTVQIKKPEHDLRVAIINKYAKDNGLELEPDIVELIAKYVVEDVRALKSVVNKILLKVKMGKQISRSLILDILYEIGKNVDSSKVGEKDIINKVAASFSIDVNDITSSKRSKNIALARQVAMFLIRDLKGLSLTDIAKIFNRKDHTTVIHAIKKIEQLIAEDEEFKIRIENIKKQLC